MNNIFLTGATGFIGQHLAEKLINDRNKVKIFTRRQIPLFSKLEKSGAEILTGELGSKPLLNEAVEGVDTVIHVAGATKTLTEKEMFRVNAEYTKNLLDACNGKNIRFIFISSQAAAGPAARPDRPVVETDDPNPLTWYGKSKLAAEKEVVEWGKNNDNKFTIIRPPSVFGPKEKDIFACFKLIKKNIAFIMGFKEKRLSIIYVKDLVNAICHLAQKVKPEGATYFACSDDHYSWDELFSAIASAMGKNRYLNLKLPEMTAFPVAFFSELTAKLTKKPALLNFQKIIEMKQDNWICSNYLLKSTGWEPSYSLKEGMEETVKWYRENNWL